MGAGVVLMFRIPNNFCSYSLLKELGRNSHLKCGLCLATPSKEDSVDKGGFGWGE